MEIFDISLNFYFSSLNHIKISIQPVKMTLTTALTRSIPVNNWQNQDLFSMSVLADVWISKCILLWCWAWWANSKILTLVITEAKWRRLFSFLQCNHQLSITSNPIIKLDWTGQRTEVAWNKSRSTITLRMRVSVVVMDTLDSSVDWQSGV